MFHYIAKSVRKKESIMGSLTKGEEHTRFFIFLYLSSIFKLSGLNILGPVAPVIDIKLIRIIVARVAFLTVIWPQVFDD